MYDIIKNNRRYMHMFIKGQTIEQFIGSQTGAMFDIVDSKGIIS